ncbi:hypothetical protein HK405_004777, partial [Cladochytrium tenue]
MLPAAAAARVASLRGPTLPTLLAFRYYTAPSTSDASYATAAKQQSSPLLPSTTDAEAASSASSTTVNTATQSAAQPASANPPHHRRRPHLHSTASPAMRQAPPLFHFAGGAPVLGTAPQTGLGPAQPMPPSSASGPAPLFQFSGGAPLLQSEAAAEKPGPAASAAAQKPARRPEHGAHTVHPLRDRHLKPLTHTQPHHARPHTPKGTSGAPDDASALRRLAGDLPVRRPGRPRSSLQSATSTPASGEQDRDEAEDAIPLPAMEEDDDGADFHRAAAKERAAKAAGRSSRHTAHAAALDGPPADAPQPAKGRRKLAKGRAPSADFDRGEKKKETIAPKDIFIPAGISVVNLGSLMGLPYGKLAKSMKKLGFENTNTDFVLTSEVASLIALEYGFNPIVSEPSKVEVDFQPRAEPEDWSQYPTRSPVVTIMGHVDHGKTTLLDALRKSSVAASEAGGITQHIGAFSVKVPSGKQITFLDTPGHAAFSAMRARGAQVTDVVVLVVAADDGVMPQTAEAIKHAQAAGGKQITGPTPSVPIVVAINKCDKRDANPSTVKEGLLRYNVVVEDFGGEIPSVEVSGLTGKGLDALEETIITIAEMADLRGDPTGPVEGAIIESRVVRGKGYEYPFSNSATMIVKRGTLANGQVVVAGTTWARVRGLVDENGKPLRSAGPALPVEVSGWKELPAAGDQVLEAPDEDLAKRVVESRLKSASHQQLVESIDRLNESRIATRLAAETAAKPDAEVPKETHEDSVRVLPVILKGDVHGSVEALTDALAGLPSHEVQVKVVSSGVGAVTDSDVELAEATKALLLAFNVAADKRVMGLAGRSRVTVSAHRVIYSLLDAVKEAMADLLPPEEVHETMGEAEVLQLFDLRAGKGSSTTTERVAGCRVLTGKIARSAKV